MVLTRLLFVSYRPTLAFNISHKFICSQILSKQFSTSSTRLHPHSHSHSDGDIDGCSHSHSHTHSNSADSSAATSTSTSTPSSHSHYEYNPSTGTVKTDGSKKIISPNDDLVPSANKLHKKDLHSHLHSHSHSEFPELDNMDLNGEDFTIDVNPKKVTLISRVKDFFNPHIPIHQFMGSDHSHSHSHATDPESLKLYDPKNLTNEGVKITWIGFGVNATMAVSKFFGGVYFHSQALIADAVHAVGDLISDILTLSTVRYTNKQANTSYPLGYGKVETFGSFMVSFILLYAGFQIGWSSFYEILTPILPHSIHELLSIIPLHSHSHVHEVPHLEGTDVTEGFQAANINAAWLALGSIVVKEWLFRATRKVGERMNSKVLIANAWHHRVDSLTSVVAVATISSGYFLNIYWLDSVGGLLVSMLIMKVGISGVVQSFKELIDKAIPTTDTRYTTLEDSINVTLMKEDSHILIKELSVLPSGTNMNIILKLGVGSFDKKYENQLTLDRMGKIAEILRFQISKEFANMKNLSVQFVSNEDPKETLPLEKTEGKTEGTTEAKKD